MLFFLNDTTSFHIKSFSLQLQLSTNNTVITRHPTFTLFAETTFVSLVRTVLSQSLLRSFLAFHISSPRVVWSSSSCTRRNGNFFFDSSQAPTQRNLRISLHKMSPTHEMADSPSHVLPCTFLSQPTPDSDPAPPEIPVEIISEEEMAIIEAAFMAARPSIVACSSSSSLSLMSSRIQRSSALDGSLTVMSKRGLAGEPDSLSDIEESARKVSGRSPLKKKSRAFESLLDRFRSKGRLFVTDFTKAEWCEKQVDFDLRLGKKRVSKAMKAGLVRHAELEEEVVKREEVSVKSLEDIWALKLINFIVGTNQLMFEGLTRELPVIGFVKGVWIVGVIDELRMPLEGSSINPTLVDTKTRLHPRLPGGPQQRNGRLQLMCYKYLWDNLVTDKFPSQRFFNFFSLNPHYKLSDDITKSISESGFPANTLEELMRYYRNTCKTLPIAHSQLLLRYELQEDNSLIGEDKFEYDGDWLMAKLQRSLEFWQGKREATYVTDEESWKCSFCQYASVCPYQNDTNGTQNSQND